MNPTLKRYLIFSGPWTVATVLVVTALMEPWEDFGRSFLISLLIAEICMSGCYWGSHLVHLGERALFKAKGWTYKERSSVANTIHGAFFMLPSLYLAFEVVGHFGPRFGVDWRQPDFANYRYGLIFGLFSTLVFVAWELYRGKKAADRAVQDLESANLKAQVAALTAQMNPHLLFNSLNSIAAMIHESPDSAEAMTVQLSNLYRRVLAAVKQERHSLAAELSLCKSYLDVEKGRFGERLKYEIQVASDIDAEQVEIPVLCVQPFVENGVKHGLLSQLEGGTLRVSASRAGPSLKILVDDDGVGLGKAPPSKGSGTAIANCKERMRIMFGDKAMVDIAAKERGTRVTLSLPWAAGGHA